MNEAKYLRIFGMMLIVLPAVVIGACVHTDIEPAAEPDLEMPAASIAEPPPIEAGVAPPPGPYAPGFDAIAYDIRLELAETSSLIRGHAVATIELTNDDRDTLALDLTGLGVTEVKTNGVPAGFRQSAGKLLVPVPPEATSGQTFTVDVLYAGNPDDGLIIGRNVHGLPTAFADNWPNRARFWFPSIDHPSDKARVSFSVELEEGDQRKVIANGTRAAGDGGVWSTDVPIPTYTMVIGVADFEIDVVGEACDDAQCIEVTTWLFPEDAERAAPSFARADEMVSFYIDLIAPFPYEKLAHVQSSTRFGGMENVTAIFYSEDALAAGRNIESTVAHETAHQWFGDSVTESDWHHLWLSEGFADYFGALFFEHADGAARFREIMEVSREEYVASSAPHEPIVNPEQDNLFGLLNANNYNKGAWILHMLRSRLGDDDFFDGIRSYYRAHEHQTALTEDLQRHFEEVSGDDLEMFFRQWVFEPGHPQLRIHWSWTDDGRSEIIVQQVQPAEWPIFGFPLTLEFATGEGPVRRTVDVVERTQTFHLEIAQPTAVEVDPDGDLLKEVLSVDQRE